jgi:hypothetical protein
MITIAKAYREDEAQADFEPPSRVVSDGSLDTNLSAMGNLSMAIPFLEMVLNGHEPTTAHTRVSMTCYRACLTV